MNKLIVGNYYVVTDAAKRIVIKASAIDVRGAASTNTEHLYEETTEMEYRKYILSELIDADHKMHETVAFIAAEIYGDKVYKPMFERSFPDSTHGFIERLNEIIGWAKEFEIVHIGNDWYTEDWYLTLSQYVKTKLSQVF